MDNFRCVAIFDVFLKNPNRVKSFFIENPKCSQCGVEMISYLYYSIWEGTGIKYFEFYEYGKRCYNGVISDKRRFINFNNFDKEIEILTVMIS